MSKIYVVLLLLENSYSMLKERINDLSVQDIRIRTSDLIIVENQCDDSSFGFDPIHGCKRIWLKGNSYDFSQYVSDLQNYDPSKTHVLLIPDHMKIPRGFFSFVSKPKLTNDIWVLEKKETVERGASYRDCCMLVPIDKLGVIPERYANDTGVLFLEDWLSHSCLHA